MFSKYFGYAVGGAEHSVLAMLRDQERAGASIGVVMVDNVRTYRAQTLRMALPRSWRVETISFVTDAVRQRYLNYYLNKPIIRRHFSSLDPGCELWSYGFYAPAAINAFAGKTVYLVRDEYGLGWDRNYHTGPRRLAKWVNQQLEYPWYRGWRHELGAAIKKSRIIANSHFIARELEALGAAGVETVLPLVDAGQLRQEYEAEAGKIPPDDRGVVLIGDNRVKGGDIFRRVAARFPSEKFIIFDRRFASERRHANVVEMPWRTSVGGAYAYAKAVLVPSRWHEAFGRVVIEAQLLGIPVFASARGGLPEAIERPEQLVEDPEDVETWCERLRGVLAGHP
jgi:glycosyltransferase involved in cell wall biosynthesis